MMRLDRNKGTGKALVLFITILLLLAAPALAGQFKVTRVVDGDTIRVRESAHEVTIRLVGIDAPEASYKKNEPGQPYSRQATKHLGELLLNKRVEIQEYGHDRHGRTLGVVYLGRTNVNLEMVKAGLAEVYRGPHTPGFDPAPYEQAEKEARDVNRGMWVQGDKYVSPREWRRMQRGG